MTWEPAIDQRLDAAKSKKKPPAGWESTIAVAGGGADETKVVAVSVDDEGGDSTEIQTWLAVRP